MEIIYNSTDNMYVVIIKGEAIGEFGYIPEPGWWKSWHNYLDFGHSGMESMEEAFEDLMDMESRKHIAFW